MGATLSNYGKWRELLFIGHVGATLPDYGNWRGFFKGCAQLSPPIGEIARGFLFQEEIQ